MIGSPSIFKAIRKAETLARVLPTLLSGGPRTPRGGSGIVHGFVTQVELLKIQKSGRFPDKSVRIAVY